MKRCLNCNENYVSSIKDCPACGFSPIFKGGFRVYSPEFAHSDSGFKSSYFSGLARFEEANFWFKSRNQLILWALEKYCLNFKSFLEIGCGTGYVLSGVSKRFPLATLQGSEILIAGLDYATARVPSASFMQMDTRDIPFHEEFDVIGAFDVLEHIEEDQHVLAQMYTAIKNPQGFILLTVSQHSWLWSPTDEYACHVRRYSASDLHHKISSAGFQIARSTSFVTSLLPAMMVSRFFQKRISDGKFDATAELKISPWLNSLFFQLLQAEIAVIRKGFNFPVGGSRLVVARKL